MKWKEAERASKSFQCWVSAAQLSSVADNEIRFWFTINVFARVFSAYAMMSCHIRSKNNDTGKLWLGKWIPAFLFVHLLCMVCQKCVNYSSWHFGFVFFFHFRAWMVYPRRTSWNDCVAGLFSLCVLRNRQKKRPLTARSLLLHRDTFRKSQARHAGVTGCRVWNGPSAPICSRSCVVEESRHRPAVPKLLSLIEWSARKHTSAQTCVGSVSSLWSCISERSSCHAKHFTSPHSGRLFS